MDRIDISNEKYLVGMHTGGVVWIENTPEAIAEFICKMGQREDVVIATPGYKPFLYTDGTHINRLYLSSEKTTTNHKIKTSH